jgi:ERCC4-type nuclease
MRLIHRIGVKAEMTQLEYGDACFDGNGPEDKNITIGIERKTLGDMLNCIDDARYVQHQRPGMLAMYRYNFLFVEGIWKPDIDSGYLLELVGSMNWRPPRNHSYQVRYSKLFRYLMSIQLAGTPVIMTRDLDHTAFNIVELFRYFMKKWDQHTSLLEVQKLNIPTLDGKPSLTRRWAEELEGVGGKIGRDASKVFASPYDLTCADEGE